MIMCVLLCYPVSIRIYYQQGALFLVATFSENVKNHKYLANRKRSSDFKQIFDPQCSTRVSYAKGKNFNFCHFWRPSWILGENEKV